MFGKLFKIPIRSITWKKTISLMAILFIFLWIYIFIEDRLTIIRVTPRATVIHQNEEIGLDIDISNYHLLPIYAGLDERSNPEDLAPIVRFKMMDKTYPTIGYMFDSNGDPFCGTGITYGRVGYFTTFHKRRYEPGWQFVPGTYILTGQTSWDYPYLKISRKKSIKPIIFEILPSISTTSSVH